MQTVTLRLVTIITERIFKERLVGELRQIGAKGFTFTDTTGQGSRGIRASEWEGPSVKIETVVSPEVAQRITDHVAEHYFKHYAVIVYSQPVDVVRGDKYV